VGVSELAIHDADEARAAALVELLADERASAGAPDPTGCDLVFNATPLEWRKMTRSRSSRLSTASHRSTQSPRGVGPRPSNRLEQRPRADTVVSAC
jgi:hypothetical protein